MLEIIMCIFIFGRSVMRKEYRYISVSILAALFYIVFTSTRNPNHMDHVSLLGILEAVLLLALTATLILCAICNADGKRHILPVLLCVVACAVRFFRSFIFRQYMDMMMQPDADFIAMQKTLVFRCQLMDVVILSCLFVMLVCVAWQIRKNKQDV